MILKIINTNLNLKYEYKTKNYISNNFNNWLKANNKSNN